MFKISIRASILTLFALLLIAIGTSIISINYSAANKIVHQSIAELLKKTSIAIESNIAELIEPLKQRETFGAELIKNKLVKPGPSQEFSSYMLHIISELPNASIIAFAEPNGSYYEVERGVNHVFNNTLITCKKNICTATQQKIDNTGVIISGKVITRWNQETDKVISGAFQPYDPRIRPWYQKALQAKRPVLSDVFPSLIFGGQSYLCVNSVYPIYLGSGKLLGMLSIKIKLQTLSDFISKQIVTKNSVTYIFDNQDNLIAAKNLHILNSTQLPKVSEMKMPWVDASLREYRKTNKQLFYFKFANVNYLAFYDSLAGLKDNNWSIGIVLPFSDTAAEMRLILFFTIALGIFILICGMVLVWLISGAISKPIIKIAHEAELITKLDLADISHHSARIKEISYMQSAFQNMRQTLKSFVRYLPFSLVKTLLSSGEIAHVGGDSRKLTFLFVDISSFTSMSEKMPPEALMQYLSEYFEAMSRIIIDNFGTVDKYIGDAIMAFWGAPNLDHNQEAHACKCAIKMQEALSKLNQVWYAQGKPQVKFRIGINSGNAIVGNVGSKDRLSYTAIGDSVNLANRIEGINKVYKTTIIISHAVYKLIKDQFACRQLDYVAVRGKEEGVCIYELLPKDHPLALVLADYNKSFQEAFGYYINGMWSEAIKFFQKLKDDFPSDNLADLYLKRCQFLQNSAPTEWDGVWRLTDEFSNGHL
ncbi:MAG: adenylate/guanylate cyclase domain-containing protein [Gammaproteobacteria bacterium]|nr:adenylate/guanylate cyclase domain-containing protein [Gammaproteobacteria bacterium]